jgi:hypothetical protein
MFNRSSVIGLVLIVLLATSIYATVGIETVEAAKKGTHLSKETKQKISESLKKYYKTGKTKKERGE